MSNHVYISIETTGHEVKDERIVEIAALKIDSKTKLRTLFHQYFNPPKEISASASGIINLTNSFLKECPIISEKIDNFLVDQGYIIQFYHPIEADLPEDMREDWMQMHHEELIRDNKVFETVQLKLDI